MPAPLCPIETSIKILTYHYSTCLQLSKTPKPGPTHLPPPSLLPSPLPIYGPSSIHARIKKRPEPWGFGMLVGTCPEVTLHCWVRHPVPSNDKGQTVQTAQACQMETHLNREILRQVVLTHPSHLQKGAGSPLWPLQGTTSCAPVLATWQ